MENSRPLISVIVPVYNVKPYLSKCLESICRQTYTNLEIIVVDDGSTDGSGAVCDKYAAEDERIIVLHCANSGVSASRNKALDIAKGDFIGFVDSDDWIDAKMYSTLLALAEKHVADIAVCSYIKENGTCHDKKKQEKIIIWNAKQAMKELISDRRVKNFCWNKLFSKSVLEGISFPIAQRYEDIAIMYRAFAKAEAVAYTAQPLYHYVLRNDSFTGESGNQLDKHKYIFRAFSERSSFLKGYDTAIYAKSLKKTAHTGVRYVDYLLRGGICQMIFVISLWLLVKKN